MKSRTTFNFGAGDVPASRHKNKDGTLGGWVADTAYVGPAAYVGEHARVSGSARVLGHARVEDWACVYGAASVRENAKVSERARVHGSALLRDHVHVHGSADVRGKTILTDHVTVLGHARIEDQARLAGFVTVNARARVCGDATACHGVVVGGNAVVSGSAVLTEHVLVADSARVVGGRLSGNIMVDGAARVCAGANVRTSADLMHGQADDHYWTAVRTEKKGVLLTIGCATASLDAWPRKLKEFSYNTAENRKRDHKGLRLLIALIRHVMGSRPRKKKGKTDAR